MQTLRSIRTGLMCWICAIGLALTGLGGFANLASAQGDLPKSLHGDLVATWKKELNDGCFDCWMFQDRLGRIRHTDPSVKPEAGYVPAFRIMMDGVQEGTLAKLPAIETPFGITCESSVNRDSERTFPDFLLKELAGLKNLQLLSLEERKVTDSGLKDLAANKNLQMLNLNDCSEVSDTALKDLARIEGLKTLLLKHCKKVTDTGMKEIAKMKKLEVLSIEHTMVTDAGLRNLTALKSLRLLYLNGEGFTPEGIMLLEKALPDCKINY